MDTVSLTYNEVIGAATNAILRRGFHIFKGSKQGHNLDEKEPLWEIEVAGCLGELAVCKYLGVYWTGATKICSRDALHYDVRTTKWENGCLLLHKDDPDNVAHILVVDNLPTLKLVGWILGRDGKLEQYWKELKKGRPCYCVPQDKLRPMSELKAGWCNGGTLAS